MLLAEARKASEDVKKIRDDPGRDDPRAARKALVEEARAERTSAYTVREMLNDYFEGHASKLAKGIEQERMLRHDVLPSWGVRAASEVTPRDAVDLYEQIERRAPRVAAMTISALRMAFELAIERRRLDGPNPCAGVKGRKYEPRERALDASELQKLLAWLPTSALPANVHGALLLQLLTGTRSGEVVNAEWTEIDLAEALWTQPKSKTKNKREHRVMLPLQAVPCYAGVRASMFAGSIRPTTIVRCCRKRSDLRSTRRARLAR